jgi:hypothetical protein
MFARSNGVLSLAAICHIEGGCDFHWSPGRRIDEPANAGAGDQNETLNIL